jgi:transposase
MFVKVTKSGPRRYVQLVEALRNEEGQPRQRTIATLGRLDRLDSRLETVLNGLLRATGRGELKEVSDSGIRFESSKALGDVWALDCLWAELGFDRIAQAFAQEARTTDYEQMIKAMVFNRLCEPDSKLGVLRWLQTVAIPGLDVDTVTHQRMLRTMDVLDENTEGLNAFLSGLLRPLIDTDLSVVFYDMTTIRIHGSAELEDDLRAYGMSKEGGTARQVMLGVVQTAEGIPRTHQVWVGNTAEISTFAQTVEDIVKRFPVKRMIVVADRGLLSLDTLAHLQTIQTNGQALEFIMAVPGRRYGDFKDILSQVHHTEGLDQTRKEVIGQTQWGQYNLVWAHNPEVASQQTRQRRQTIKDITQEADYKASKMDGQEQGKRSKGRKLSDSGTKAWLYHTVKELRLAHIVKVDLKAEQFVYEVDESALKLAEMNDGKLLLVTNVTDMEPQAVVQRYKSLADIERGFRVLKNELEIGPVYHRLPKRIRAHAAICFMALVMHRVIRQRLKAANHPLSPQRALQLLRQIQKHRIHLPEQTTVNGISNISTEQTDIYGALNLRKPNSQNVQLNLL